MKIHSPYFQKFSSHISANNLTFATLTTPNLVSNLGTCIFSTTSFTTLSTSCTISGTVLLPYSLTIASSTVVTMTATSTLLMDLHHNKLLIKHGGGLKLIHGATFRQVKSTDTSVSTPTITYHLTDHLGSVTILTNTSGAITELSDYYPYGSVRMDQTTGNTPEQRKYIGQYYDEDSKLNYLQNRYMDSSRGQFLSEDPVFWEIGQTEDGKNVLANPQAQNSYSYAGDNPITNKDPDGRKLYDLSYGFTTGPFGLNGGLRYEPGVGWQIYSSNSVGLGMGASIKYDPNGHLDQSVSRGDTYSQKEFVVAPIVGGYTSTSVIENPMDPFDFSNNPKKSKGLAFGLEVGATYSTEHEGSINQTPRFISNFSSVLQTTVNTTGAAISQVRSTISSAVQSGAIKIGNAIGSFIGTYNFGGNVGSYDTSTGKWK